MNINTLPIENFLEKTRIASKNGSKTVVLDVKEAQILSDCLAVVMTKLVSRLYSEVETKSTPVNVSIKMDGGNL